MNVGLAIQSEANLQIHCPARLEKVRAISLGITSEEIRSDLEQIPQLFRRFDGAGIDKPEGLKLLRTLTCFEVGAHGEFFAHNEADLEGHITGLLRRYVEPELGPAKPIKKKSAKLRKSIREALKAQNILAKHAEEFNNHKVIANHKLSEGIVIDFILKNSAMHICEAVDLADENVSIAKSIKEIAMSALTFEHAKMAYEGMSVMPRLIYRASAQIEKVIGPSLAAVSHQGAELVNWESGEQRSTLIDNLSEAAVPYPRSKDENYFIHSSLLPIEKLN